jgi:hypothetical protein
MGPEAAALLDELENGKGFERADVARYRAAIGSDLLGETTTAGSDG